MDKTQNKNQHKRLVICDEKAKGSRSAELCKNVFMQHFFYSPGVSFVDSVSRVKKLQIPGLLKEEFKRLLNHKNSTTGATGSNSILARESVCCRESHCRINSIPVNSVASGDNWRSNRCGMSACRGSWTRR
jgi:hypothetical protein